MKIFVLTLLLTTLTNFSLSQDCNNPLLPILGLTDYALAAPEVITDAKYCPVLQDGTARSCCTVAFLNQVQEYQDNFLNNLQAFAGTRDSRIRQNQKLVKKLLNAVEILQNLLANVLDEVLRAFITADIATITEFVATLDATSQTAEADFADYQQKRATCFAKMIDIQASAFCLACDATYLDRGVNSDTLINMANETCFSIIDACYPYLQSALQQNQFAAIRKVFDLVRGYSNITADLSGQERPDDEDFEEEDDGHRFLGKKDDHEEEEDDEEDWPEFNETAWKEIKKARKAEKDALKLKREKYYDDIPEDYENATLRSKNGIPIPMRRFRAADEEHEIKVPAGCEDPNNIYACTWICDQAFQDGQIQINILGAGGELKPEEEDGPEEEVEGEESNDGPDDEGEGDDDGEDEGEDDGGRRMLVGAAGSLWAPQPGEAGTTIILDPTPSEDEIASAERLFGLVMVAALAFIFMAI